MTRVIAAIIIVDKKILIAQRKREDRLSLKWEFPGGKMKPGETPRECLKREIKEELNIDVIIKRYFGKTLYDYYHGQIELMAFVATVDPEAKITPLIHQKVLWVDIERLIRFDFAPADIPFVHQLMRELHEK